MSEPSPDLNQDASPKGLIVDIVRRFLSSRLSILFIIFSLGVGVVSIIVTPREEEPQIVVPLADIFVQAPGASAEEVEKLVSTPLERLLWQIDGVEYVYSISRRDMAIVTVRFFVGEDREKSLVKLHNKINMNIDLVPPIVKGWVIKPIEIDDVPIVNLTLYSDKYDDHQLRRIGEELISRLSEVKDISRSQIVGGRSREVRVELIPDRMEGLGISILDVENAVVGTDAAVTAGTYNRFNRSYQVTSDSFVTSADEIESLIVGVHENRPVYVRDIGRVIDGPEEAQSYSRIGFSHYYRHEARLQNDPISYPAVTLALAKKKGSNAVEVANNILKKIEDLKDIIPTGVKIEVSRNYGQTAQQKVNDLLSALAFAVIIVVGLLALTLGWREALVVAVAVPISFSLALFVNFLFGYTINRVTLFALILSLGLVVDDPITNVDNIQRHILKGRRKPKDATLFAVNEVLPPVIMSTLAIIISFTPMFFITGMMGPYMAPMAANVPLTVIFSTACALTCVPWLSYLLLRNRRKVIQGAPIYETGSSKKTKTIYRSIVGPFLESRGRRYLLLIAIFVLLAGSITLPILRWVPFKMLPFDNKNEFQIVLDMPEGTTLEATNRVLHSFEVFLMEVPEITHFITNVGIPSPIDFNGMVRHYYLRNGNNFADIRVNLVDKNRRKQQSHAIVLRLRKELEKIAQDNGVSLKIVEVPPGPPVVSTLVAEIYGSEDKDYKDLIQGSDYIKSIMSTEPFVVDIDDTVETERARIDFILDKEKAGLHGVSTQMIIRTLKTAISGESPATIHEENERQPLPVKLILPSEKRTGSIALSQIPIKTSTGKLIPLGEFGTFKKVSEDQPIYHKNLERVVYVFGEIAGRAPAEAVIDMTLRLIKEPLSTGISAEWAGEGEWKITLRAFRDLILANMAALTGIYTLLVIQMNSFTMPLLIMVSVPLTMIGIMPGFWLFNLLFTESVGGFQNPVFFTATSMIGMIALGGIVIRNSLVLIEFIQDAVKRGKPFKEAILQSGAIRLRPILLTAATTALGAWPITLDPVFSGLAWALIFGLFASTLFTLIAVPVTYYAFNRKKVESSEMQL